MGGRGELSRHGTRFAVFPWPRRACRVFRASPMDAATVPFRGCLHLRRQSCFFRDTLPDKCASSQKGMWGSGGGARTSNLRIGGGHRGGGYGFAPALLAAGRELEFVASLRGGGRAHGGAARRSVGKKVDWITRWGGGVSRKRNAVPSGCRVRWEVRAAMLDLILIRLRCYRGTAHKQPEKFVSRNTQYVMDTVGPALRWVHVPDGAATSGTEHM